jgi:hypothetical protein
MSESGIAAARPSESDYFGVRILTVFDIFYGMLKIRIVLWVSKLTVHLPLAVEPASEPSESVKFDILWVSTLIVCLPWKRPRSAAATKLMNEYSY